MLRSMANPPYTNSTLRQPPSQGDITVALTSAPSMNPAAMPIEVTPLASPSWRCGNQLRTTLMLFIGTIGDIRPKIAAVRPSVKALPESPRSAPATPPSRLTQIRTRCGPNRSPITPPNSAVTIPGREAIPQIRPTCVSVRPRSSEISSNSTGMHMLGMAVTMALVRAARPRITQR